MTVSLENVCLRDGLLWKRLESGYVTLDPGECADAFRELMADRDYRQRRALREWQPIETARALPVGTPILVYRPLAYATNDPAITIAITTKTARESPQGVKHYTNRLCHPTHWISIPEPPSSPEGGRQ